MFSGELKEVSSELMMCLIKTRQQLLTEKPWCDKWSLAGACDEATNRIISNMKHFNDFDFRVCHGEIRGHLLIDSIHWGTQHTWGVLSKDGKDLIWFDCTMDQFESIIPYAPRIYMSNKPPVYFIDDNDNWIVRSNFYIPKNKLDRIKLSLSEFLVYKVKGKVFDLLRGILGLNDLNLR